MRQQYTLTHFPPRVNLLTVPVLGALVEARGALGELKGRVTSLPNPNILLDTLSLQEALASSEIENIVTTQDEAFRAALFSDTGSVEAKEVARYRDALRLGYAIWKKTHLISEGTLIGMFRLLKQSGGGYRQASGTVIVNSRTGETIYKPPQSPAEIRNLMRELARFVNYESSSDLDSLIKMALIHHQFESIHPFPDGNGRIGRVLNVLYLTHKGLLDAPILYLSRAINRTKPDYYRLLQAVREEGAWEEWVIYILGTVTETAKSTLQLVSSIWDLMAEHENLIRKELPKIYSQDLLNNLFRNPYTRIDYVAKDLSIDRRTARKYLKQLTEKGVVEEVKAGRNNYYINRRLTDLLTNVSAEGEERSG